MTFDNLRLDRPTAHVKVTCASVSLLFAKFQQRIILTPTFFSSSWFHLQKVSSHKMICNSKCTCKARFIAQTCNRVKGLNSLLKQEQILISDQLMILY